MKLHRDGIALGYDDAGTGAPPALLIHGWAVDRSVLQPLFEHARRSRRVVSVDLRGHGKSDAPEPPCTIAGLADDVAFVAAALQLERPVVIGHSMGGLVALEFVARYRHQVSALVILESMVVSPPEVITGMQPVLEGVRRGDRDLLARVMQFLAGARCDPRVGEQLVRLATACPLHVLRSAMEDMLVYDSAAAAARVTCPLLYVGTGTTYADLERLRALCPQLVTEQLVDCGHYFPLEAPERLHPLIDRFLARAVTAVA